MHKSVSKKTQELSIIQAVDNYLLTETERFKFYNQCKKTIRQKFDVVNLGMLIFFNCLWKKKFEAGLIENCKSFNRF